MAEPSGRNGSAWAPRHAAAEAMRRLRGARPTWCALAALALLGLIVMPVDYRGGATQPHTHSLLQLVLDASDGTLRHEHAETMFSAAVAEYRSWFDPGAPVAPGDHVAAHNVTRVDPGTTSGAVGSYTGILFLLAALVAVTVAVRFGVEITADPRRPRACVPRILLPPPRVAFAP